MLTFLWSFAIIVIVDVVNIKDAAVAQSVERRIGSAEVTGPIPVSSFHARHEPCNRKGKEPEIKLA